MNQMNQKMLGALINIRRVSMLLLPFMGIVLTLVAAYYLVTASLTGSPKGPQSLDLPTVLSSMGTLAIFIFSMFIAVAAFIGWGTVKAQIREKVEEVTNKRLEQAEKESRGRSFAILGYVIGENSVNDDFTAATNEERLREAIFYCERGYEFLQNTNLPVEFMALNNLLGYSCVLGEKARRGHILERARRLRAAAEEHDAPNLLLTSARTTLEFSLDPKEIDEACSIVADVRLNPRLIGKQAREAEQLASLCEQRTRGKYRKPS